MSFEVGDIIRFNYPCKKQSIFSETIYCNKEKFTGFIYDIINSKNSNKQYFIIVSQENNTAHYTVYILPYGSQNPNNIEQLVSKNNSSKITINNGVDISKLKNDLYNEYSQIIINYKKEIKDRLFKNLKNKSDKERIIGPDYNLFKKFIFYEIKYLNILQLPEDSIQEVDTPILPPPPVPEMPPPESPPPVPVSPQKELNCKLPKLKIKSINGQLEDAVVINRTDGNITVMSEPDAEESGIEIISTTNNPFEYPQCEQSIQGGKSRKQSKKQSKRSTKKTNKKTNRKQRKQRKQTRRL